MLDEVVQIAPAAPFRHLVTPGGYTMSVAMTNCGRVGWVSDATGYRYDIKDPGTGAPWPPMPKSFLDLAVRAAAEAGFVGYDPDACLINRYVAGAKLGLHQYRDENDPWAPIVSVSLGLPAVFLWGGKRRSDPVRRLQLENATAGRSHWRGDALPIIRPLRPLGCVVAIPLTDIGDPLGKRHNGETGVFRPSGSQQNRY